MKYRTVLAALAMGMAVSGCASVETATRNVPLDGPVATEAVAPAPVSFKVEEIRVSVPQSLKVSEANRYYPSGDIVWREDPPGDRHAQVRTIVEAGLAEGIGQLPEGGVPVILDVEVMRFHAVTEKARYTIGGVHAIQFKMVLRNPATGEAYGEPQLVKADFKALGGQAAIEAEAQGITQKYRITKHLAQVIQSELTSPEGYRAANLGLLGAINQL